jgi:hypothetical protein
MLKAWSLDKKETKSKPTVAKSKSKKYVFKEIKRSTTQAHPVGPIQSRLNILETKSRAKTVTVKTIY